MIRKYICFLLKIYINKQGKNYTRFFFQWSLNLISIYFLKNLYKLFNLQLNFFFHGKKKKKEEASTQAFFALKKNSYMGKNQTSMCVCIAQG